MSEQLFRRNRQRVTDLSGVLVFLKIEHATFSAPFLLVNDSQNHLSNGLTYVGYPFGFKLPDDRKGENPRVQLAIDNVGRDITGELEGLAPGSTVMATVMVADRSAPDYYRWVTKMPLSTVQVTPELVTANVGVDFLMRRSAVLLRHDERTSPGIFQ